MNAIHYIDALNMVVPYCHVVPDREMTNLLSRSGSRPAPRQDASPVGAG